MKTRFIRRFHRFTQRRTGLVLIRENRLNLRILFGPLCAPSEIPELPESGCGQRTQSAHGKKLRAVEEDAETRRRPDAETLSTNEIAILSRPFRARRSWGRVTQGGARGLALPWAEESRAFGPGGEGGGHADSLPVRGCDGLRSCKAPPGGKAKC